MLECSWRWLTSLRSSASDRDGRRVLVAIGGRLVCSPFHDPQNDSAAALSQRTPVATEEPARDDSMCSCRWETTGHGRRLTPSVVLTSEYRPRLSSPLPVRPSYCG